MTVLSAQSIRWRQPLDPIVDRQQHPESGCSFGLSACGYDIRLDQEVTLWPGEFKLASSLERFQMPDDLVGIVHDKSTWVRRGLMVHNTVIEPGWRGFLTLELAYHVSPPEKRPVRLLAGTPIAQVVFHFLDHATEQPYPENAKYMDQPRGPVAAKDGDGHG